METIKALHVNLEGFTAFFKVNWSITASQLTLATPAYSNLLGLLSACSGKIVRPVDTRIGFEFSSVSEGEELEMVNRWMLSGRGLKPHTKGQSPLRRQTHFKPKLDLYLTNLSFEYHFNHPAAPLTLGRSQDLCWITKVEIVDLIPKKSGSIGSTMISDKLLNKYVSPDVINSVEWFENYNDGYVRTVGGRGLFQVIPQSEKRTSITASNLYHPSNLPNPEDVIYLHEWSKQLARVPPRKKRK